MIYEKIGKLTVLFLFTMVTTGIICTGIACAVKALMNYEYNQSLAKVEALGWFKVTDKPSLSIDDNLTQTYMLRVENERGAKYTLTNVSIPDATPQIGQYIKLTKTKNDFWAKRNAYTIQEIKNELDTATRTKSLQSTQGAE